MKAQDEIARKSPQGPTKPRPAGSIVCRALIASTAVIGIIAVSLHVGSAGASWPIHGSGDAVSQADAESRAHQFAMLAPLPLSLVSVSDVQAALDGMHLEQPEREALAAALAVQPASAQVADESAVAPHAAIAPAVNPEPTRLAWVTLWDTDAEDGDVVRLDSEGYSRTVTLAKKPVTFAVPVTRSGIIKVTGVRDGEGGGITVGLASGTSQAVFPIMSTGQTLGLRVSFGQ